jgi:hypothetical protein
MGFQVRNRSRRALALLGAAAAAACLAAAPSTAATLDDPVFGPGNVWTTPLAPGAPLDARSSAITTTLVTNVRKQMTAKTGPSLSARARASVYEVGASIPLAVVKLDTGPWADGLKAAFREGVPIPAGALPSTGSDAEMAIWQPSSDTYWEFFQMQQALHFPQFVGVATAATGGSLEAGAYWYKVTAINARGETTAKAAGIGKTVAAGSRVTFKWAQIEDATGYRVYRGPTAATARLLTTLPATAASFTDTGAAQPAATAPLPPAVNTAATPGVWRASFGGRIEGLTTSPGHYRDAVRPGATTLTQQFNWGATATSLPVAAGMITKADLERGRIDHAIAIALPNLAAGSSIIDSKRWAYPAQRGDGKSTLANAVPEGARFRLDPALDLSTLNVTPFVRMLAEAAQRYGLIVQDGAPATLFYGEDPSPYERRGEPNFYDTLIGPRPSGFLNSFPWDRLQLTRMTLCSDPKMPCLPG